MNTINAFELFNHPEFFRKVPLENGCTFYLGVGVDDPSEYIFYHNPNYEKGYGGATVELPLEGGTTDEVKGIWHSNPVILKDITGIEV